MKTKYKCLYEITGCIEDVATFLVPIADLPKQEQGEPQPALYVKDIDGNFHLHKEKGHTENCAAFGDDCSENHLSPSRFGVGKNNSTTKQEHGEPVGEMQLSAIYEGMVVPVVSVELPAGTKLYTTPHHNNASR